MKITSNANTKISVVSGGKTLRFNPTPPPLELTVVNGEWLVKINDTSMLPPSGKVMLQIITKRRGRISPAMEHGNRIYNWTIPGAFGDPNGYPNRKFTSATIEITNFNGTYITNWIEKIIFEHMLINRKAYWWDNTNTNKYFIFKFGIVKNSSPSRSFRYETQEIRVNLPFKKNDLITARPTFNPIYNLVDGVINITL